MANKLEGKGLIFSPDFITIQDTIGIIKKCRNYFSAVKVGNIMLYREGIDVIQRLKDASDLPVICDFKIMDIPDVAEELIGIGAETGMDGAMIWGMAGEETVYRCISSYPYIMIFLLTEYTHSADVIDSTIADQMARMAVEARAYGIQAPATRPNRIAELRRLVGHDLKIISCGVGYQGASYGSAIKHGADFEIIGRAIYRSDDPVVESKKAHDAILSTMV
ncbi:MAG: orotidine-5'-phosphate decarboxylase [Deltaproteobacteria bacterium]|nr:orotidine-5'-phosphate decarboxylase [Deltaproteobacteria bacterium]